MIFIIGQFKNLFKFTTYKDMYFSFFFIFFLLMEDKWTKQIYLLMPMHLHADVGTLFPILTPLRPENIIRRRAEAVPVL